MIGDSCCRFPDHFHQSGQRQLKQPVRIEIGSRAASGEGDGLFRVPRHVVQRRPQGPPLEYVCEKTRRALESLHSALRRLPGGTVARSEVAAAFAYARVAHP